jgi:hypothetical protein
MRAKNAATVSSGQLVRDRFGREVYRGIDGQLWTWSEEPGRGQVTVASSYLALSYLEGCCEPGEIRTRWMSDPRYATIRMFKARNQSSKDIR